MARRLIAVRVAACVIGLALRTCAVRPADELAAVRQFIPAGAKVFFHAQANLDDTPAKEWIIAYQFVPPGVYGVTYEEHYNHFVVLRQDRGQWRKVLSEDGFDELELRDLDGDRILEVVIWWHDEGNWGFDRLDFRRGQFCKLPGLDFYAPESHLQGFVDLEGDGPLEMVATGWLPGYLAAMAPELSAQLLRTGSYPQHSDVRFYRFVDSGAVLYFPHPRTVVRGLNAGLASGYRSTRLAAIDAAGILGVAACVPRLIGLLTDADEYVVQTAIEALRQIGTPEAHAALLQPATQGEPCVVQAVAHALPDSSDSALAQAVTRLGDDPSWLVWSEVVNALARFPTAAEAIRTLLEYFEDPDDWVRGLAGEALKQTDRAACMDAIAALAAIGDPSALPALRQAATSRDEQVASAAKWALVKLQAPEATGVLIELSQSGDQEAKRLLVDRPGELVEQELVRSLTEDAPMYYVSVWGDWGEDSRPGWFLFTSRRLGEKAIPILMSRVARALPSHTKGQPEPAEKDCWAAVAAAHCLRELGAVEAIPLLLQMSATHPYIRGRDVATRAVVSLRRKAAGLTGSLFADVKP